MSVEGGKPQHVGLNSVSEKLVTMSSLAVHSIKREAGTGGSSVPAGHGIPVVATASRFTAPVHIDVGGQIYTSSLDTLTRLVHSCQPCKQTKNDEILISIAPGQPFT